MLTRTPSSIPNSNLIPSDISPPPSTLHQPSLHTANTTNLQPTHSGAQPTPIKPQPTPSAFQPTHTDPLPTHTNPLPTRTNPHVQPTNPQPIHPMITRSKNSITKPKTFTNGTVRYPVPSALLTDGNPSIVEPTCFTNAVKDSNWCAAMNVEFDALLKNQTWLLVSSHTAQNVIGCKWVFWVKRHADGFVEHYKARLVAKGFHQLLGIDFGETFNPVIKPTII